MCIVLKIASFVYKWCHVKVYDMLLITNTIRRKFSPKNPKFPSEKCENVSHLCLTCDPMDGGAWQATVHEVTKIQIQLSDWARTHAHKDLLYTTRNSTQYSVMAYLGKESKIEWMYVQVQLIPFGVHLKLTQYCKSTIQ